MFDASLNSTIEGDASPVAVMSVSEGAVEFGLSGGSPLDSARALSEALELQRAGKHQDAVQRLQSIRQSDSGFAVKQDVDYAIAESGNQLGDALLVWDASRRWLETQPSELRSPGTQTDNQTIAWTGRRGMVAQAMLWQIQSAYQLGMSASDVKTQSQWLDRVTSACDIMRKWQPAREFDLPCRYYQNVARLQQILGSESGLESASLASVTRALDELAGLAGDTVWGPKAAYYHGVAASLQRDYSEAVSAWENLLIKDRDVSPEIRKATLFALAESQLTRWFLLAANPETTKPAKDPGTQENNESRQWLVDAEQALEQLQLEFPDHETLSVTFNRGTSLRLLGDHAAALRQFQSIPWPAAPETDLAATMLAWQANFNAGRTLVDLGQWQEASDSLDSALSRLEFAPQRAASESVLLRLRVAEKLQDATALAKWTAEGRTTLSALAEHKEEIGYLLGLGDLVSSEVERRAAGRAALESIAESSDPFAGLAGFALAAHILQTAPSPSTGPGGSALDKPSDLLVAVDFESMIKITNRLLESTALSMAGFPQNPALRTTEQNIVLEQRHLLQLANAWSHYRLANYPQAAAGFLEWMSDQAVDDRTVDWELTLLSCLASSDQSDKALERLSSNQIKLWPPARQGEAWFLRGQLLSAASEEEAALEAFSQSAVLPGVDQVLAMQQTLNLLNAKQDYAKVVALGSAWEPILSSEIATISTESKDETDDVARSNAAFTLGFLKLQQGFAHYQLGDYAQAEQCLADVFKVSPSYAQIRDAGIQSGPWLDLLADAEINRSLALNQLGQSQEAQDSLKRFLQNAPSHTNREMAVNLIRTWDPTWIMNSSESSVAETSGTETTGTESSRQLSTEVLDWLAAAESAADQQDWTTAARWYEQVVKATAGTDMHPKFLHQWALSLWNLEQVELAGQVWTRLLNDYLESPLSPTANFYLGQVAYRQQDFTTAIARFQVARTTAQEADLKWQAGYMEAWAEQEAGDFTAASSGFAALLETPIDNPRLMDEVQILKGRNLFAADDMEQALKTFDAGRASLDRLGDTKPELVYASQLQAGKAALSLGQYAAARGWLDAAVKLGQDALKLSNEDYSQAEAAYLIASCHRFEGAIESAEADYEGLIARVDALGARALNDWATMAAQRGDDVKARRLYQALANAAYGQSPPSDVEQMQAQALLQLGLLYLRGNQIQVDPAVRTEFLRQAKTWLTRAQLQTASPEVAATATQQLQQLIAP
jgi:tetratricopeptide (TPR) repeat protein